MNVGKTLFLVIILLDALMVGGLAYGENYNYDHRTIVFDNPVYVTWNFSRDAFVGQLAYVILSPNMVGDIKSYGHIIWIKNSTTIEGAYDVTGILRVICYNANLSQCYLQEHLS